MDIKFNKPFLVNVYEAFSQYIAPIHRNILVGGTGTNKNDKREKTVSVYVDALNTVTTVAAEPQFLTFANQSFLTCLDKINTTVWKGGVSAADMNQMKLLVNTLIHGNEVQRNSALDKLVAMGILLESDIVASKLLVSSCFNYKPELVNSELNEVEGFYSFSYNVPVTLQKKYSETRNVTKEKLYLLFVGRGHSTFGYSPVTGETFGHFATYWNEAALANSLCLGYMAVDMGEIGGDDKSSIRYDHLDVIEVIDNIKIQLNIPNHFKS